MRVGAAQPRSRLIDYHLTKINFFWLLHYVTENAARQNNVGKPNPINRVWFDDIVVSTEYVGSIHKPSP